MANDTKPDTTRAATDVSALIADLEAGVFERILSIALSQVASAVTTHESKKGQVSIKFEIESISGTGQVRLAHKLSFKKPTGSGWTQEEMEGATALHVGRYGALSITQPSLIERDTQMSLQSQQE